MDVSGALVTTDGLVSVSSESNALHRSSLLSLQSETGKQRELFVSRFSKHGRSVNIVEENDDWSRLKIARADPMPTGGSKAETYLLNRSSSHSLFPTDGPQMLSFSSLKPDTVLLRDEWPTQFFNYPSPISFSAPPYPRNAGLPGSGSSDLNVNGALAGIRGPFTHSQWFELEHQALIYKYLDAKVPIPSNLIMPIRRTISPTVVPSFTPGSYRSAGTCGFLPNRMGWGPLHLGCSGNTDPEPGRCRRTDGKKWRCSRDAVSDQKYCERHMNRGRHRSRKRVEGHGGHGVKEVVPAATSSQSASAVSSAGSSSNFSVSQQQDSGLQTGFPDPLLVQSNRSLMNGEGTDGLSQAMLADLVRTKTRDTLIPLSKQQNPFEETSTHLDFGLVSTDSLLNSQVNYSSENDLSFVYPHPEATDQHTRHHPFLHFIDDWSKNSSNRSNTELSISIPVASPEFSSSTSSPNKDKMLFSPLRLSCKFSQLNDGKQSRSSLIPISWEPTIGGPLGEVLTNTSGTLKDLSRSLSSSSLNLLTDGWNRSARFESSPTGVLQKSGFGSLSSSNRSSPLADNHDAHHENDELLGSLNPC